MKANKLFLIPVVFLGIMFLTSCDIKDEEEGRKITGYKEYTMTVASKKLPGVINSSGADMYTDVFAVKKDQSSAWEAFGGIRGFEYEEGCEYRIRISETNYLDYKMGDPAWTEYSLLEVLSKVEKDSENLPFNFIPKHYFENRCRYISPDFAYAVDADNKDVIEKDLISDDSFRFGGMRYYIVVPAARWFLVDEDVNTVDQGYIISRSINASDLPDSYKMLLPGNNIAGFGQFDFAKDSDPDEIISRYDVFFSSLPGGKSAGSHTVGFWLYRDLTSYYQNKYPNVKAVAIRYAIE